MEEHFPSFPEEQEDLIQTICLAYLLRTRSGRKQEEMIHVDKDTLLMWIACEEIRKKTEKMKKKTQLFSAFSEKHANSEQEGKKQLCPDHQTRQPDSSFLTRELLKELTGEELLLFWLKEIDGWDYRSLSGRFHRSETALACQIYRTRKKLQDRIQML